jgi:predicted RND superfamily exporter protein
VTVSVSYLIHFISEFHIQRHGFDEREPERLGDQPSLDPAAAISATFGRLLRPGLWTSVTTAIGFASLTVSPVAPIRHVGLFAAVGIGLAWLNTIIVAPALLSLLWRNRPADRPPVESPSEGSKDRLMRWLARPRPIFALVLAVVMLAGAGGLIHLQADTDYVKFFRPGSSVRNDYAQLGRLGLPSSYLTVTVRLTGKARFADIDRHRAMRRFEISLRSIPGVMDVQSLDAKLESLASALSGDDARDGAPTHSRFLENLLALSESGRLDESDEFLADDGRLIQLRVMTGPMSTRDINRFRDDLGDLATDLSREWEVALIGTNVLWANMDAHVVRTQLLSIAITAAILLVLLPLVFQSLVLGILGFAVSFVPVLCTLGLMAWLGLPINIATCILGGVVIGLSVDDTIYFLSRVREGLLLGLPVGEAAQRATGTTGRAMIKTSLILTGGFLTMAASDFMPSVYFGIFFAVSILIALLADLIVLPVALRLVKLRMR